MSRSHTTDNFRWEPFQARKKWSIDSSGVLNVVGGYELNGTTVIDSTRRALMSVLPSHRHDLYATDATVVFLIVTRFT